MSNPVNRFANPNTKCVSMYLYNIYQYIRIYLRMRLMYPCAANCYIIRFFKISQRNTISVFSWLMNLKNAQIHTGYSTVQYSMVHRKLLSGTVHNISVPIIVQLEIFQILYTWSEFICQRLIFIIKYLIIILHINSSQFCRTI